MRNIIKLTAIAVLTAAFLSGCQQIILVPGKTTAPEESVSIPETSFQEPETIKEFPVILNGTEITEAVKTVVSLTPAYSEILFEMGYGESIIGVCDYCDYPEKVKNITSVGSSTAPDIQKIISLKPDLVITATPLITKDRIAIESKGIKILTITSPKTIQEFRNIYKFIGLAFEGIIDGEDKGESAYKAVYTALNEAVKNKKHSFLYISPTMATAGGDTFEHSVLSVFGNNKAESKNGYSEPTANITENQPDIIFLSDRFEMSDIEEHEIFSQLEAVKNGRVIIVESIYFERPTARIGVLLKYISDSIEQLEKSEETSVSEDTLEEETGAESEETDGDADNEYYE
jgi:iron complex transport system substrate-binding protein